MMHDGFARLFAPAPAARGRRPRRQPVECPSSYAQAVFESGSDSSGSSHSFSAPAPEYIESMAGGSDPDDAVDSVASSARSPSAYHSSEYNSGYVALLSSPDATDSDLDSQPSLSASAQSAAEEPAAPVAKMERGPIERLDAWPVLDPTTGVCVGKIVWNKNARSLDAHCHCPTHRTVAEECRLNVNRTVNTPKRPGVAGGRPLGFC